MMSSRVDMPGMSWRRGRDLNPGHGLDRPKTTGADVSFSVRVSVKRGHSFLYTFAGIRL